MLASGSIYDPQTWNRYSYTLNNPLKYIDPSGLYVYASGTTDEQKKKFEKGLEKVRSARDHYRQGSREYNRLDRALTAYGARGVDNGVTVKFGSAETPGNTNIGIKVDASGNNKETTADNPTGQNITVTLDPSRNSSDNDYAFAAAHEGSHVADMSELIGALPRNLTHFFSSATVILNDPNKNLSLFATEFRAYETESFAAQALASNRSVSVHGYDIWSGGWAEADRAKKRTAGIIRVVAEPKSQGGRYGVTPFGPGRKLM